MSRRKSGEYCQPFHNTICYELETETLDLAIS